jgi:RNA polymerase sigma factor (sigma-70 family)
MTNSLDRLAVEAQQDKRAFEQLYELLYPRIYNYIRYRSADLAEAEELVSQTFERMMGALGSYDPGRGPFEPWVFAIARNLVTAHYRKRALRTLLPWEWFHAAADPAPQPEEAALLHESEAELLKTLPRLNRQQRDLLGLRYGSELSNPQIAALTGLSESHVAVTLHRAIGVLRQILNPQPVSRPRYPKEAENARK